MVYFIPEFPRKEDDSCFQIGAEFGMYCKKLLVEVYNRVYNHKTLQEEDKSLIVIHGPIVYVDNKDDYFNRYDYEDGTRSVMSLFVKDFKFTIEQEYRFVILPCEEPILDQVILPISDLFRGCFFLPWETTLA